MALDKKDIAILAALQDNAKQSSRDLSKKTGMPATTIHERIKKLESDGVIKGYHVAIDYEKAGMPTTAIVLIRRSPITTSGSKSPAYSKIADKIAKLPEVQEAHVVTGEYDMVLKVRGKNERELGTLITDTIWRLPEVERTLSLISFYTPKDTCRIELKQ